MSWQLLSMPLRPGRLACSLEGAGKRRIFAIGQCNNVSYIVYTIGQCGSYPDLSVMEPSDGPIHRLRLKRPLDVFSFDLSSATDRWPVSIIHDVVACMFGPTLASCIVNGSLALSAFDAPFVGTKYLLFYNRTTIRLLRLLGVQPITSCRGVAGSMVG